MPLKPLPPECPLVALTVAEVAAARAAGHLEIHDNGVLTLHRPGEPARQIVTPSSPPADHRSLRGPLTAEHRAAIRAAWARRPPPVGRRGKRGPLTEEHKAALRAAWVRRKALKVPDREENPQNGVKPPQMLPLGKTAPGAPEKAAGERPGIRHSGTRQAARRNRSRPPPWLGPDDWPSWAEETAIDMLWRIFTAD